ncbi:hypothetical protein ACEN8I_22660 [Polaromonas sp. CT11-55]|uniref:hypothetical protein n=1 Tax=Polaromonas sp. CT11-55 TaxID=3243045 RepID=UPI0039A47BDE
MLQSKPLAAIARGLTVKIKKAIVCAVLTAAIGANAADPYVPVKWTKFVKVEGQTEPVPEQWLQDAEARIAYSLRLPDVMPKPVPYDFSQPIWERWWINAQQKASIRYFNHLCSTEAGEWIVKKVENVEGFYFARPQGAPTSDTLTDPYGPEMPWIQRAYVLTGDSLKWQGAWFIQPPLYNYRFVEQPRRSVDWQKGITEPHVRLFGYTREPALEPNGKLSSIWKDKTPMQVVDIPILTARYGYTWRGVKRPQDREHGIAGGELIIYDLQTKEVLAVRRQFLIASHNPRGEGKAMWEVAARCPQLREGPGSGEFTQFAFDVLQTTESSSTKKK